MGIQIEYGDETPAPESSSPSGWSDAQILIADENPATLEFFSRLLEDRGFTTFTADSGEAVMRLLFPTTSENRGYETNSGDVVTRALLGYPLRVILLGDLMKPPIDGLDLLRRLRPYQIPIVVATSYGADYTLLAKMAGAEIIIHKFADPTYLITTIEQAISSRPPLLPTLTLTR